jgi:hypothetical protein
MRPLAGPTIGALLIADHVLVFFAGYTGPTTHITLKKKIKIKL